MHNALLFLLAVYMAYMGGEHGEYLFRAVCTYGCCLAVGGVDALISIIDGEVLFSGTYKVTSFHGIGESGVKQQQKGQCGTGLQIFIGFQ